MNETGWIIPGSYAGNRITSFRWTTVEPEQGGVKASRKTTLNGYIYTVQEGGDVYEVERGIITRYEKGTQGS